jgi:hypothetical protein
VTDLERSHLELRTALILAGKEIRKLNFGRRDTPLLRKLRQSSQGSEIGDAEVRGDKYHARRSQIYTAGLNGKTTACGTSLVGPAIDQNAGWSPQRVDSFETF